MKSFFKIIVLFLVLIGVFAVSFYVFFGEEMQQDEPLGIVNAYYSGTNTALETSTYSENDTWAIYWYLCGSDLESDYGAATEDINEMLAVDLPENIKVVIQTGGAEQWQNDFVSSEYLERYIYDGETLECVSQIPSADMGETGTLQDFLSFCKENYPAQHTIFLFWNHGGGNVNGVAYDEKYNFNSLTLDEMRTAFSNVYELSEENPPFELVGFDACLMATIDTAYFFSDIGRYLVASEELEPANGWYYTGWLQTLADNPSLNGAQVGKAICDSYVKGCKMAGTQQEITLSVTDLSKVNGLISAYNEVGTNLLNKAAANPLFLSDLGRMAIKSENYGGNTINEGYSNLVDLGSLMKNIKGDVTASAENVLKALEDCVIYRVNGDYRNSSYGLSCYYSYNADKKEYEKYAQISASKPFSYLVGYEVGSELDAEGVRYLSDMGFSVLEEVPTLDLEKKYALTTEGIHSVLNVGTETASLLKSVTLQLYFIDKENNMLMKLGKTEDLIVDFENGIFKDNFRGVWGGIDGHLVYMDLTFAGDGYSSYAVPVMLNGEEYNLRVVYDFNLKKYEILGARKGIDKGGKGDRGLLKLKEGDIIEPIYYYKTYQKNDAQFTFTGEPFTVTDTTIFEDIPLGNGNFALVYELTDLRSNTVLSNMAFLELENDTVTITTYNR